MTAEGFRALRDAVVGQAGISVEQMLPALFDERLGVAMSSVSADTDALFDLGRHLFLAARYEQAFRCFQLAARNPLAIGADAEAGRCEVRLGRFEEAERRARSLIVTAPQTLPGWRLLGEALRHQGKHGEAIDAFVQASRIAPRDGSLQLQLAHLYESTNAYEAARDACERAFQSMPSDMSLLVALVSLKRRLCDWDGLGVLSEQLKAQVAASRVSMSPIDFLSEGATAALELACAKTRVSKLAAVGARRFDLSPGPVRTERLRVGFVSHGFGPHPTAVLTSALFERLRSSAVEAHLFSTSNEPVSVEKRRFAAAAHQFHDISGVSAADAASLIHAEGIEILIDLDGYSRARQPEILAHRPAPIQVNWLGYPGTTGASFFDYIIADRFVLPESLQPYFSETVAYLPRCYQCSDSTRAVVEPPSREACGLPPEGDAVYVCFNASYKINPRSFLRMMCVLREVPRSVLWLLKGPGQADERLRIAARRMGVDPSRLIFMAKLPHASYLSRYRHADLFLDTEHYNAHTTASDALWADCPVLTRPGETFATRVAGSLNHHLGMDEMNVRTDDDFVVQAIRHGRDAAYRTAVREKLIRQKQRSGLFDVAGYARDFVALLMRVSVHHRAGGVPADFPSEGEGSPSGP